MRLSFNSQAVISPRSTPSLAISACTAPLRRRAARAPLVRDRQNPQPGPKKLVFEEIKSMRTFLILASTFFLTGLTAHAQSDNAGDPAPPDRSYQLLREDE